MFFAQTADRPIYFLIDGDGQCRGLWLGRLGAFDWNGNTEIQWLRENFNHSWN
jgi:hypothetical protein